MTHYNNSKGVDVLIADMEAWRPVVGFEGFYSVSSFGQIKSDRTGKILRTQPAGKAYSDGRRYRSLRLCRADGQHRVNVHAIVCEAFNGPRPAGHQAAHGNGLRDDNRSCNLAWKTPAENAADKIACGTLLTGERHQNAKLNDAAVSEIRSKGGNRRGLAARFGVSASLIDSVRRGLGWAHVGKAASQ